MTETEKKWRERVQEWMSSGRTATEFAQGRGFEGSTLRFWASRLRAMPEGPAGTPGVRMARVKVTPRRSATSAPVVVAVGRARIEVRAGFDGALLREVIDAIGGEQ